MLSIQEINNIVISTEKLEVIPSDRKINTDFDLNTDQNVDLEKAASDMLFILNTYSDRLSGAKNHVSMGHKITPQFNMLNGDKYNYLLDDALFKKENTDSDINIEFSYNGKTDNTFNNNRSNQFYKHLIQITILDDKYYDGIYQTYTDTIKDASKHFLKMDDGICDIVIRSNKKIDNIELRSRYHILINNSVKESIVNGKYEYRFIYDDGTPYMAYPEFLYKFNCNNVIYLYCSNNDSSAVSIELEYKNLLVVPRLYKYKNSWYNIIPTNKKNIYCALSSMDTSDYLIDLENDTYGIITHYVPRPEKSGYYMSIKEEADKLRNKNSAQE